jgi:hypothetical protein
MLAKHGGVDAYRHAHRKVQIAEDQYYKSLYDIDLLERKLIVVGQLQPILKVCISSVPESIRSIALILFFLCYFNISGVCCSII